MSETLCCADNRFLLLFLNAASPFLPEHSLIEEPLHYRFQSLGLSSMVRLSSVAAMTNQLSRFRTERYFETAGCETAAK